MANRLSLALLSMCSLSVTGAKTLYEHSHSLLVQQETYPGDAEVCSPHTISTFSGRTPSYELDKCYIQGAGTGAPTASMYSHNDTGHVITYEWLFDCTSGKKCNPRCEDQPPKSEWRQVSLGVKSCSPQKKYVHGKGLVIANWCDGDDVESAFACVAAAVKTPLGKGNCPNADLSATTVKKLCGTFKGQTCGCFSAGTNDLV